MELAVKLLLVLCLAYVESAVKSPPHIVFILADDLGWNDVSFHGSNEIPTPNLDAMAYDGIQLSNYYVQPICTPTRAALLTGRHPIHLGLQHSVILTPEPFGLGLEEKLLPEYLKELHYSTHAIGKWHLGFYTNEHTPTYRGFDSHYGYFAGRQDYWDHTINEVYWGLDFRRNMEPVKTDFGKYATELFTEEAESLIHNHNSTQPMFLYLAHLAVHTANSWRPLEAQFKYYERFNHIKDERRRTYAAMVSALDESFGRVVKALHRAEMLDNTIIVFSTDNGGAANNFNANAACNLPLRGLKETLWEGGMRGAGFIWSPLLNKSRYTSNHMMQVIDWLPTLLSAAGYNENQIGKNIDGVNQWKALSGNSKSARNEILHNIDPIYDSFAIRHKDMKLIYGPKPSHTSANTYWYGPNGPVNDTNCSGTPSNEINEVLSVAITNCDVEEVLIDIGRAGAPKRPFSVQCGPKPEDFYTNCNVTTRPCLFNITADPCEYENLANEMPHIVQSLLARVVTINSTAVPIRNAKADPRSNPDNFGGIWMPWLKEINYVNTNAFT